MMFTTKNKAFTLAEVLITLGIIGIVAAMTLPILINNYKKSQTVNQLKASYSILSQAVKMSEVQNGETQYWNYSLGSKAFFDKYLKNYLKLQKTENNNSSHTDIVYKWLNGSPIVGDYKEEVNNSYVGMLANGSLMYVHSNSGYSPTLMIDINGYKNPNKVGIDLFHFAIIPKQGLQPWGFATINTETNEDEIGQSSFGSSYDRDTLTGTGSAFSCNATQKGRWCTALIMSDGWEMKEDYPWSMR